MSKPYLHQRLNEQPKSLRQLPFEEARAEWADRVVFWSVFVIGTVALIASYFLEY